MQMLKIGIIALYCTVIEITFILKVATTSTSLILKIYYQYKVLNCIYLLFQCKFPFNIIK